MKDIQLTLNTFSKAARLQQIAAKAKGKVDLLQDHYIINAKSILGIFSLDLNRPMTIRIYETEDEDLLVRELVSNFI